MYLSEYKIIRTTIAVIFFITAIFLFIFGFSRIETNLALLENITPYGFILITLSLLIIWQGAGSTAGLIIFSVSVPLIILVSVILKSYIYNFQILTMLGIAIPSHLFFKKATTIFLEEEKRIEDSNEQRNVIGSQMAKDMELAQAFLKKLDRYKRLKELGEVFNAKLSLEDIYNVIIGKTSEIIGKVNEAKLFLVDKDSQDLKLCSSKQNNVKENVFGLANFFDKWVLDKGQPLLVLDATRDFRFDYQQMPENPTCFSVIIVPMVIQQRIIGVLHLGSRKRSAFTEYDLRLLDFISDMASAAIYNATLYIQTEELAITDSLTGLYVHRYFKERLAEEFNRCKDKQMPLSIIMLDIDHFKDYNDKYGHAAGDKVLKGISDILRHNTSPSHIIARYGGEEFVALFPTESKDKAALLADEIRQKIRSATFTLRRQETKVTVSIGVAGFPQDAASEEELVKKVDFLLYKAKKEGRNKVCVT